MPDIAEFPIPETVDPGETVCIKLNIPAGTEYLQVFLGWYQQLSYWFNWERDDLKRGTIAASLWRVSLYDFLDRITEGCGENDMYFRLRAKPDEPRIMQAQWAIDGDWFDVLDNTCCEPAPAPVALHQFSDDGKMQVSYDGGVTWIDDPDDPRNSIVLLPLPTGADVRCKVAQGVVGAIKQQADKLSADAGAWGGITGLLVVVLEILVFVGIIGSGGALTPLLLALSAALLEAGKGAFDAAMTTAVYVRLQEIVYCALQADGNLTESGWAEIRRKAGAEFAGIAGKFIVDTLGIWQVKGTNQAGRSGVSSGNDCSEQPPCPCEDHFFPLIGEETVPYYPGYRSFISTFYQGVNRVEITTGGNDQCCTVDAVAYDLPETTGGTFTPFVASAWKCGDDWSQSAPNQPQFGECRNRLYAQSHGVNNPNTVFVMSVLFSECEV